MTEQELKDFLFSKYESGELTDALNTIDSGSVSTTSATDVDFDKLIEYFMSNIGSAQEEEIQQGNTRYKTVNGNAQLSKDIKWLIDMKNSGITLTPKERVKNRVYRKNRVDFDV